MTAPTTATYLWTNASGETSVRGIVGTFQSEQAGSVTGRWMNRISAYRMHELGDEKDGSQIKLGGRAMYEIQSNVHRDKTWVVTNGSDSYNDGVPRKDQWTCTEIGNKWNGTDFDTFMDLIVCKEAPPEIPTGYAVHGVPRIWHRRQQRVHLEGYIVNSEGAAADTAGDWSARVGTFAIRGGAAGIARPIPLVMIEVTYVPGGQDPGSLLQFLKSIIPADERDKANLVRVDVPEDVQRSTGVVYGGSHTGSHEALSLALVLHENRIL